MQEFSRSDLVRPGQRAPRLRLAMYAALLLGAAFMCILTIWEHAGHHDEHHA